MKKKRERLAFTVDLKNSWQDREVPDDRLESMVNQLLDADPELDDDDAADDAADSPASYAGGSKTGGSTPGEKEIESLLDRMVFSQSAFLKYPN